MKSKLQNTETRSAAAQRPLLLCYRPTAFFRHLSLIAPLVPEGKIQPAFQNYKHFNLKKKSRISESPYLKIVLNRGTRVVPIAGAFEQIRNQIYWIDNLIPILIDIIPAPVNDINKRVRNGGGL